MNFEEITKRNEIAFFVFFVIAVVTCNFSCHRRPSESIHDAVSRKGYNVKEILELTTSDPTRVNSKNDSGETPLQLAIIHNHADVVLLLLKNGADVHLEDSAGMTALHYASTGGQVTIVDSILKFGADPNAIDRFGNTPLHYAIVAHVEDINVIYELHNAGAKLDTVNGDGETPIDIARREKRTYSVPLRNSKPKFRKQIADRCEQYESVLNALMRTKTNRE